MDTNYGYGIFLLSRTPAYTDTYTYEQYITSVVSIHYNNDFVLTRLVQHSSLDNKHVLLINVSYFGAH